MNAKRYMIVSLIFMFCYVINSFSPVYLFQCYAKFTAKETLNRHMRTHTGNKPHSCKYCGKTFIQLSQLRAHIFHHTGKHWLIFPFSLSTFVSATSFLIICLKVRMVILVTSVERHSTANPGLICMLSMSMKGLSLLSVLNATRHLFVERTCLAILFSTLGLKLTSVQFVIRHLL